MIQLAVSSWACRKRCGCHDTPLQILLCSKVANAHAAGAGHDTPFVNNYGVWSDEFKALGLEGTLDQRWPDAHCWFGEGRQVRVGRAYGRCAAIPVLPVLVSSKP